MKRGIFLAGILCLTSFAYAVPFGPDWLTTEIHEPSAAANVTLAETVPILDQYQTTNSGGGFFWANRHVAQTFTPSFSGTLDRLESYMDSWYSSSTPLPTTVRIVDTVNGVPSGAVLASINVPSYPTTIGWNTFSFASQNVYLQADHLYGYIFLNNDPEFEDNQTNGVGVQWGGNVYPRGKSWQWTPQGGWEDWSPFYGPGVSDLEFRTWMTPVVPEPVGLAMLVPLLVGLHSRRRGDVG